MGPFGTNRLAIAVANAGALGLISSSALESKDVSPDGYNQFRKTFEPGLEVESAAETLKNIFRHTLKKTQEAKGIFGLNVLVSAEILQGGADDTSDDRSQGRRSGDERAAQGDRHFRGQPESLDRHHQAVGREVAPRGSFGSSRAEGRGTGSPYIR